MTHVGRQPARVQGFNVLIKARAGYYPANVGKGSAEVSEFMISPQCMSVCVYECVCV